MEAPVDVAVPIVFPDYLIHVGNLPSMTIEVPDMLPWIDVMPDKIKTPPVKGKAPYLGHAGILFIDGKTGGTKYYEYGRYDTESKGIVRNVLIPDVVMKGGRPVHASLEKVMARISAASGQRGAISAAYIELPDGSFSKMLKYAEARKLKNKDPSRVPYDLISNSCLHFMKEVAQAGGATMPPVVVPTPNVYMKEVRLMHHDLGYSKGKLAVPLLGGTERRSAAGGR
jgi:hypothetical protein